MREARWLYKHNPYHKLSDLLPIAFRIAWKARVAPLFGRATYNLIIPETKHHAAWFLGSQPTKRLFKQLKQEGKLTLVSLVTADEFKLSPHLTAEISCYRQNWYDHSYLDENSKCNITAAGFIEWITKLVYPFKNRDKSKSNQFYCHCMAGQARSLMATLAFLYLYPEPEELFDFALWPKEFLKGIPLELQEKLRKGDDLNAVWQFVKLKRPQVRKPGCLDGEQLGLLGLLTLHLTANLARNQKEISDLGKITQKLVWLLGAPLSLAYRTEQDVAEELDNFALLYQVYLDHGRNLVLDLCHTAVKREKQLNDFDAELKQLSPLKRLRLLICLSKVEKLGEVITPAQIEREVVRIFREKLISCPGELILSLKIWGEKLDLLNPATFKWIIHLLFKGNIKAQYQRLILLEQLLNLSSQPARMLLYLQQEHPKADEVTDLMDFYAKFNS